MTEALADIFSSARSPRIDWEGRPAHAIYEIKPAPVGVVVEFLKAKSDPVQGLTLKASGGALVVNGVEAPEMLLWQDTMPGAVTVGIKPAPGKTATLKIWNIWRGHMGGVDVIQAWLGNAAMRIEDRLEGRELLFRCSDGEGPVDFSDLEARVTLA